MRCRTENQVTPCMISWATTSAGTIGVPSRISPKATAPAPSGPNGGGAKKALS